MTKHCIDCGETPASLREYEDYKGNKTSVYHCDDCATQTYRHYRQESRDHQRTQEEAKKKKQQAEQVHKEKEYKSSRCQQCGKKSSLYHYIYDKRTGKLTSSTNNATDVNNQTVFCTKEHFQSWLNKHKAKLAEALRKKGQKLEEQNEILEDLIAKQEELQRILAEELEKETSTIICAKCGQSITGKHWINKQDQNTFCSESCYDDYYTSEKCNNEDEKNNKKSSNISKIFNTCAGCQKDISQETSYYLSGEELTRHWCANCYPKNDNSPNLTPTKQTNHQRNLKCYNCKKNFNYGDNTHYFPQEPNKKWCDTCNPEVEICLQATQQIFQNQEVNVDNLNISTENKEQLKALTKIKKGEKVNVDHLNIDKEAKDELKKVQKQISPPPPKPNDGDKYSSICLDCKKEWSHNHKIPTHCHGCQSRNIKVYNEKGQEQALPTDNLADNNSYLSWIIGGAVFCILLIPYFIWRKKKKKELEKQGKKMPWYY